MPVSGNLLWCIEHGEPSRFFCHQCEFFFCDSCVELHPHQLSSVRRVKKYMLDQCRSLALRMKALEVDLRGSSVARAAQGGECLEMNRLALLHEVRSTLAIQTEQTEVAMCSRILQDAEFRGTQSRHARAKYMARKARCRHGRLQLLLANEVQDVGNMFEQTSQSQALVEQLEAALAGVRHVKAPPQGDAPDMGSEFLGMVLDKIYGAMQHKHAHK